MPVIHWARQVTGQQLFIRSDLQFLTVWVRYNDQHCPKCSLLDFTDKTWWFITPHSTVVAQEQTRLTADPVFATAPVLFSTVEKNQNTQLFQQLDLLKEGVWKGLVLHVHAKISFTEIFPQLLVLKYVVVSLKPGPQQKGRLLLRGEAEHFLLTLRTSITDILLVLKIIYGDV